MLPRNTQILENAEAVAVQACAMIGEAARVAIRERGVFRLVMAGGRTPARTYALLADTPQEWNRWELFWGDERCLPVGDAQRNSQMSLPSPNLYPISAERGAEAAALSYAQIIADKLPFDLVLLGMGEDGHTASLFPGFRDSPLPVVAVHDAPKPPPDRVSLTLSALQNCRQQLILVTGTGKTDALMRWQAGENLPIAQVSRNDACLLTEKAMITWL